MTKKYTTQFFRELEIALLEKYGSFESASKALCIPKSSLKDLFVFERARSRYLTAVINDLSKNKAIDLRAKK